jgi:hypothetical protein
MPIISCCFIGAFCAFVGVYVGLFLVPFGAFAYALPVSILLWTLVGFFRSDECDIGEVLHLVVPVGSGSAGVAAMQHEQIDWLGIVLVLGVTVMAYMIAYIAKRARRRTMRK